MLWLRLLGLYFLVGGLILLWTAPSAWGLRIAFLPQAEVQGSVLRLGDVAEISPQKAAQRYQDMELFHLPSQQTVRVYRASTLRAYIQQHIDAAEAVTWAGEKRVTVRRAGGELIDGQMMKAQVQDYLQDFFDHPAVTEVQFVPQGLPQPFTVSVPDWECTVRPSSQNPLSARRFSLLFRGPHGVLRNLTVRGKVRVQAQVAVAKRDLGRDHSVAREDVHIESRELARRVQPMFDLAKVVGKRITHSIRAGSVIESQDIARPHLVRRREPVTLIVRKGKMMISASGIAQEDGAKMDRVCVENTRSGQEVYGHVVAKDTVEVGF